MAAGKNGLKKTDPLQKICQHIQKEISNHLIRNIRVFLNYVRNTLGSKVLVDVRSPKEFTGEILAPPEYPTEHAQRGGHIPGAANIPWAQAVNVDGTFKQQKSCKSYTNLRAYLLLTQLYAACMCS